ncbi:MAG: DsbA family protein [Betaproteobacteria bacterium]|jgi:2-hydroxychromene-2-carboxylate isomerase|nr:DsbA family protein [Betaproteobacteria bacterium]
MDAVVDLFWSFRSPYSYLAVPGAIRLEQDFRVKVVLRPVLPLAVRDPSFFSPDNVKRAKYIIVDWPRRAEMLGVPHAWPSPDPIVQDMKNFKIADEQPYIYRLSYLGVEAERRGRGLAFAREVSLMIFGGTRDWHLGEHLAQAAQRAGLELAAMDAAIAEPASHRARVEENQRALADAGHWGVPTFVFDGEPFFGEDRIDTLRWRLGQHALQRS